MLLWNVSDVSQPLQIQIWLSMCASAQNTPGRRLAAAPLNGLHKSSCQLTIEMQQFFFSGHS